MAFSSKLFKKVSGIIGRRNDILYSSPLISSSTSRILVFFSGDTQDFKQSMAKHRDSAQFQEFSLQNTSKLIAQQFPQNHIVIIRAARRKELSNGILNCFDNFVSSSEFGVPTFLPNYESLLHLERLFQSFSEQLPENSKKFINEGQLSLMGFSKGCVVLNQFLHEFHYHKSSQVRNEGLAEFICRIKEMWWVDGGHPGQKDTWITDEAILNSFITMGIDVHVHVTPYQTKDFRRPWIRVEEQKFSETLKNGGANIQRTLHFGDQPRKLERHFAVLKELRPVPEGVQVEQN